MDRDNLQRQWIEKWDILPIKGKFPRTKSKEIISSQLYLNMQRSLSSEEHYFRGNKNLFQKNKATHNREIFDLFQSYIVIDSDKIPENFIKLFELDINSSDIQTQVKELFHTARLLDKNSARIVFIEDKIVIFRNEEKLTHKVSKGLTQWEKRRTEIETTFNTFSNIYDAIRSQYHIIQSSENKKNEMKDYKKSCLELAQEVRILWIQNIKDGEWKRKIEEIIYATESARNFSVLAANLQNLSNLTLQNSSIDANLIDGWKNKFTKRFSDLQKIIWVVNSQLNDLENILIEYENLLELFLSQIKITDKDLAYQNYTRWYKTVFEKYGEISPFSTFNARIEKYKAKTNYPNILGKIETLIAVYKDEHKKKLSWEIFNFEWFDEIKDNLNLL